MMLVMALLFWGGGLQHASAQSEAPSKAEPKKEMTKEEAVRLGEQFGIVVAEVDEGIRKELGLQRKGGVAVLEVIGGTAHRLGIAPGDRVAYPIFKGN